MLTADQHVAVKNTGNNIMMNNCQQMIQIFGDVMPGILLWTHPSYLGSAP